MQAWRLHPQARLRRTALGGAVFLPATITTVELDAEAFAAVSRLTAPSNARDLRRQLLADLGRNYTVAELDQLLRALAEQQVLTPSRPEDGPLPARTALSAVPAPESIHLQLNNVCNLRCPSCYVALQSKESESLSLARLDQLLEEWAAMGVFQLALGGGEPLLSPRFVPAAYAARRHGLVPNVTTNGWLLTEALLDKAQGCLGEFRLSLNDAVTTSFPLLETKTALLRARRLRFGFNLIVTRRNLERLDRLFGWVCAQGAGTLNLIRPKPTPHNQHWYRENALTPADVTRLATFLREQEPRFTGTSLTVDCAFSFLFHGQQAQALQARGVAGCAMGERFATVKWNGDVFPCSHLHGEQFKAGNVLSDSFCDIWERSAVLAGLRANLSTVAGKCGSCSHQAFCKGCRAVMWQQTGNWLAPDAGCPATSP